MTVRSMGDNSPNSQTIANMEPSITFYGLKGIIQFWIKTVDKVWQARLTEELKISQFLPREMRQIGAENDN